jgi:hypothetical protein
VVAAEGVSDHRTHNEKHAPAHFRSPSPSRCCRSSHHRRRRRSKLSYLVELLLTGSHL